VSEWCRSNETMEFHMFINWLSLLQTTPQIRYRYVPRSGWAESDYDSSRGKVLKGFFSYLFSNVRGLINRDARCAAQVIMVY